MGKQLGRLVHKYMKRRRHIAEVNIKRCFPTMSEAEQQRMAYNLMTAADTKYSVSLKGLDAQMSAGTTIKVFRSHRTSAQRISPQSNVVSFVWVL